MSDQNQNDTPEFDPCAGCPGENECSDEEKAEYREALANPLPIAMIVMDVLVGSPPQARDSETQDSGDPCGACPFIDICPEEKKAEKRDSAGYTLKQVSLDDE